MYDFFLGGVQLPITPSKLQIKIKNQNKVVTLIDESEISIPKQAGLTDISFDIEIPHVKYPYANYPDGFKDAEYYLSHLKKLKTEMKSFQFKVARVSPSGGAFFDTEFTVLLEEYTIVEDAKNGLDLTVSIKLKQYVPYSTKVVVIRPQMTNSAVVAKVTKARESNKVVAKTHKVVSGETLWGICKKELGDGSKYVEIAKLNNIKNPNKISVGQVIKLA